MGVAEGEGAGAETAGSEGDSEKQARGRSTIEFPYSDLSNAIEVAQMINDRAGLECEVAQLAAWMGQSATGGTFRSRYSASRIFGLIETERGGRVRLTELGFDVLNAQRSDKAKAQAFLSVALFRQIYETYKGRALPPSAALQRVMKDLGVAPKQVERARQTFIKSAQVAQFIDQKTGVFIEPAFRQSNDRSLSNPPTDDNPPQKRGGGDDVGLPPHLDPIIRGLIDRLPKAGDIWPSKQRELWLGILKNAFELVYKEEEDQDEDGPPRIVD